MIVVYQIRGITAAGLARYHRLDISTENLLLIFWREAVFIEHGVSAFIAYADGIFGMVGAVDDAVRADFLEGEHVLFFEGGVLEVFHGDGGFEIDVFVGDRDHEGVHEVKSATVHDDDVGLGNALGDDIEIVGELIAQGGVLPLAAADGDGDSEFGGLFYEGDDAFVVGGDTLMAGVEFQAAHAVGGDVSFEVGDRAGVGNWVHGCESNEVIGVLLASINDVGGRCAVVVVAFDGGDDCLVDRRVVDVLDEEFGAEIVFAAEGFCIGMDVREGVDNHGKRVR